MFDIHCHILTEKDSKEALDYIKEAVKNGVKKIILTPEVDEDDHKPYKKKYFFELFSDLKETVKKEDIPVELELGMELEAFYLMEEDVEKYDLTLGQSNYVLIDCKEYKQSIDDMVYEFLILGYQPIISDVALYDKHNIYNRIKKWKNTGALIQMSATSLFHKNRRVRRRARKIIRLKLADFISSGANKNNDGFKALKKAKWYVRLWCSKQFTMNAFRYNAKQIFNESNE